MDKKLVRDAFVEIAGKIAEPLVEFLDSKKYMNEFLIAKKLDLPINQTRNILYKISEHGLVSSTRKKDKKKGWFTYSWKIEELKSLEYLKGIIERKMGQINHQINNRETKEFYTCERCHVEFNEENSLLHDFTCPECGSILTLKDNTKLLKELRKNYDAYEVALNFVNDEITKGEAAEAKKIRAKETAEKKAKAKERAERAAIRKKEREAAKAALESTSKPKKTTKKKTKTVATKTKSAKSTKKTTPKKTAANKSTSKTTKAKKSSKKSSK
jgi:transcription factor E